MKKRAVLIGILGARIEESNPGVVLLKKMGYEVDIYDPVELICKENWLDGFKERADLIIGASLGGVLAPKLATKYPKADLVLMVTSARVKPESKLMGQYLKLLENKWGVEALYKLMVMPTKWWVKVYAWLLGSRLEKEKRKFYEREMQRNVDYFKKLPKEKTKKVIGFLTTTNNQQILKNIKNRTIIFAGLEDKICPVSQARKLNKLVEGSRLVVRKIGHFEFMDEDNLKIMREFLEERR